MVAARPPTTGPHIGGPDRNERGRRIWPPVDRAAQYEPRSLGDVWHREGRSPGIGLTVTPTSDGAVIHPTGEPAPAPIPVRCTPATRGRTLHISAGVDLTEVGAFVDSLPVDLRPANYTVAPGVTFDRQPPAR